MSSRMGSPGTPKQRQDLEVWREAWEREMEKLPPDRRFPFPDPRNFNVATQARKIIDLLEAHGIPCCVIGVKALCYYGAPRICSVCPHPEAYLLGTDITDDRLSAPCLRRWNSVCPPNNLPLPTASSLEGRKKKTILRGEGSNQGLKPVCRAPFIIPSPGTG